jgi:uridine kinase
MRGDKIVIEDYHRKAAQIIALEIVRDCQKFSRRYIVTLAGESGSGKSETSQAIEDALEALGIKAVTLAQDDYFVLPPYTNDAKRREDPHWLGPHVEVKMDLLEGNIVDALTGADVIKKPLVDYQQNTILDEKINLSGVKVIIAEGTYASLLRNVDLRIFIDRDFQKTLQHRRKRGRGQEVDDPFVESILALEHKIIAGHKHLANIIITKDYQVMFTETRI